MAVQVLKHEYELLIRFEEEAYDLWGLYQQAVVGNVNVPSGSLVSLQKARVWSSRYSLSFEVSESAACITISGSLFVAGALCFERDGRRVCRTA